MPPALLRRIVGAFRLCVAAVLLATAAPQAARAGSPVVVELYTSQGCAACPPADALLDELADSPDLIALALHVDYWDYLGWRDVFAQPAFTARQVAYRDRRGARSVFTPEIVVQGATHHVGSRRAEVKAAIEDARARPPRASLELRRSEDRLEIRLAPPAPETAGTVGAAVADARPAAASNAESPPAGVLWFVAYRRAPEPVKVERGENGGREFRHRNVVVGWMKLGRWDGLAPATYAAPAPEPGAGVAVILQEGKVGDILAAAKFEP